MTSSPFRPGRPATLFHVAEEDDAGVPNAPPTPTPQEIVGLMYEVPPVPEPPLGQLLVPAKPPQAPPPPPPWLQPPP